MCHRDYLTLVLLNKKMDDASETSENGKANLGISRGKFTCAKPTRVLIDLDERCVDSFPEFTSKSGSL